MGRTLTALRRSRNGSSNPAALAATGAPGRPASDAEVILVETEEIPFIEVGPKKSMEASASVLACAPPKNPPAAVKPLPPAMPSQQIAAVPSTQKTVQFRALPDLLTARAGMAPELIAYHAPNHAAARQYAEVLAAVLHACSAQDRSTVVLFTSLLPHFDSSTTLLNLAIIAAGRERRVLVVDANLRQPSVAERLGIPCVPGLREVLAGSVPLEAAIQPSEQNNLFALTAGLRDSAGVRFVSNPLRSLLRQLCPRYPLVLVDGPSWDGSPQCIALGTACDAVFLVMPEQQAETPETEELLRRIPSQGARLAGCILVADSSAVR
jgi:Mrp family chromosome partitioning ATPase